MQHIVGTHMQALHRQSHKPTQNDNILLILNFVDTVELVRTEIVTFSSECTRERNQVCHVTMLPHM